MVAESSSNAERAAEILIHLGKAGPQGASLGEINAAIDAGKAATRRALVALSIRGFTEGTGKRGHYRLGPAIYGLANRPGTTAELVSRFRPAVIDVAAATGQSSYLMMRAGFDAICVDMHEGTAFVQTLTGGVGGRVPLGVGPGSLSIMTGLEPGERESVIRHNRPRFPLYNGVDEAHVRERLGRALEQGFSYDIGETFADAGGVAVPIPARALRVSAALSIAIPASLLDEARAREIQALIGACIARRL